jgi:hypothetical protein
MYISNIISKVKKTDKMKEKKKINIGLSFCKAKGGN